MLLLATSVSACGSDTLAPHAPEEPRLYRLTERGGLFAGFEQRTTYSFDSRGRLNRIDLESIVDNPDPRVPRERLTYFVLQEYDGDTATGGRTFLVAGGQTIETARWEYAYDAAGQITRVTRTALRDDSLRPIRDETVTHHEFDAEGRLIGIAATSGEASVRTLIEYDANDNVSRETHFGPTGDEVVSEHSYDTGRNPFHRLAPRLEQSLGLVLVVGPWAVTLSPQNVTRTEIRANGEADPVAVRTVEILEYDDTGFPVRSRQTLWSRPNPDDASIFEAAYEYRRGG